jgi:hypothetical protein
MDVPACTIGVVHSNLCTPLSICDTRGGGLLRNTNLLTPIVKYDG